jgi:hypothetical protein
MSKAVTRRFPSTALTRADRRELAQIDARAHVAVAKIEADARVEARRIHATAFVGDQALQMAAMLNDRQQQLAGISPEATEQMQWLVGKVVYGFGTVIDDVVRKTENW